jgi:hypothetical protein
VAWTGRPRLRRGIPLPIVDSRLCNSVQDGAGARRQCTGRRRLPKRRLLS